MLKQSILILALLFVGGCKIGPETDKEPTADKYKEYKNYNLEILPLLETGYEVKKIIKIQQKENVTPERFLSKLKPYHADFVMVDTNIINGQYNFTAVYIKKIDISKMLFGAQLNPSDELEVRENFGSNKGCVLGKIYYDTPAYIYDFHEHDIITYANNEEVKSCNHLKKIMKKNKSLDIVVWANGSTINVDDVQLNK